MSTLLTEPEAIKMTHNHSCKVPEKIVPESYAYTLWKTDTPDLTAYRPFLLHTLFLVEPFV